MYAEHTRGEGEKGEREGGCGEGTRQRGGGGISFVAAFVCTIIQNEFREWCMQQTRSLGKTNPSGGSRKAAGKQAVLHELVTGHPPHVPPMHTDVPAERVREQSRSALSSPKCALVMSSSLAVASHVPASGI